jgi:hypothetical protein
VAELRHPGWRLWAPTITVVSATYGGCHRAGRIRQVSEGHSERMRRIVGGAA